MKITVATMDRAIQAAIDKPVSRAPLHQQDRSIYLRGFADAAKVEDPQRDNVRKNGITEVLLLTSNAWDNGHDAHAAAIREAVKRLRKEVKG